MFRQPQEYDLGRDWLPTRFGDEIAGSLGRDGGTPNGGGLAPGAPADLVAVPAATVREAIAFGPTARRVWRAGIEAARAGNEEFTERAAGREVAAN